METKAVVVRVELAQVGAAHPVVWYAVTADLEGLVEQLEAAMTPATNPVGTEIAIAADWERTLVELVPWWARLGMVHRIRRDRASHAVIRARISPAAVHLVDSAMELQASGQQDLEL